MGRTCAIILWLLFSIVSVSASELVGAWQYVETYLLFPDGKKVYQYSTNPKGIFILLPNGRYSHLLMRDDLPKVASGNNQTMTPEEAVLIAKGSLAHYGTYTFDKEKMEFVADVEVSDFPNLNGRKQTRKIVELTDTTLRYINDVTNVGGGAKVHATLKRVW